MDEKVMKQKIQKACFEPGAPEHLIQKVILRTQAVSMGVQAQKQLESSPGEKVGEMASRVLIGQLAAVSDLPKGLRPEQLAHQLEQEPAFRSALHGGNIVRRLNNGELMHQVLGHAPTAKPESNKSIEPIMEGPAL